MHNSCISFSGIVFGRLFEKVGLCSHPKSLNKQHNQNGQFIVGTINTICRSGFFSGSVKMINNHEPVDCLIDNSAKTNNNEGCRVDKNLFNQFFI